MNVGRTKGAQDPKIQFHQTIKEIETRLDDPSVTLNSFVVSNTPVHEMEHLWGVTRQQMEACHILFQQEGAKSYIHNLLWLGSCGKPRKVADKVKKKRLKFDYFPKTH